MQFVFNGGASLLCNYVLKLTCFAYPYVLFQLVPLNGRSRSGSTSKCEQSTNGRLKRACLGKLTSICVTTLAHLAVKMGYFSNTWHVNATAGGEMQRPEFFL